MISELYQHIYSYANISFIAELKQALRIILWVGGSFEIGRPRSRGGGRILDVDGQEGGGS